MTRPGRVLVTGAAGFIGSTLVERLLDEGREVVGLDAFDAFYDEALKRRNLAVAMRSARYRLVRTDIRDVEGVDRLFAEGRFEGVVHLAALAGVRPSLLDPARYADVNVNGSTTIFAAATRHGAPRIVFASSSSVYGERSDGPFRETDCVDRPVSPYAATKKAGELLAHSFHHAYGLSISCARIFTAFGPRQRPDLAIRKFAARMQNGEPVPILGDGSAVRDFTYVDDLVSGLVAALDRHEGYAVMNFGAGRMVSVLDVVRELERALGVSAKIEFLPAQTGDVSRTWADISLAKRALGYAPRISLEEGIARFVAWWKEQL